ncbi:MAG: indolepyruvate ferredoxin oxidoreductase family protein [Pseudomonadota bacterium]
MTRPMPAADWDREYQLDHNLTRASGRVFLSGTQALVRLLLEQRRRDRARGLNTSGFVSGYRGSPLGMVDQALWQARALLEQHDIRFLPAINEELAATAIQGTQQVEADPERTVDGVFALWYGKGPGVDRAGDALKHGNAYGSSPHGGVLVVCGDDHGCVSSSMPHQSEQALMAWSMPVLNPAEVGEYLEFGLYGWALSRFSGAWVGFKAISETVESARSIELPDVGREFRLPEDFVPPADGLHNRWPDFPSLAIEARLAHKLAAARAFARANPLDRLLAAPGQAELGIVTVGKAHLDVMEALRLLGLDLHSLAALGIRLYKVGQSFPLEPHGALGLAAGLKEVLVVEEKGPVVEQQLKELLYNRAVRPVVLGKEDRDGRPLLSAQGELRPGRVGAVLTAWLRRHRPQVLLAPLPGDGGAAPADDGATVRRVPYFCSGCPHNTSTRVPEGSRAGAGIGCHFMAAWMERNTVHLSQMGGEGVAWAGQSLFTRTRHMFQNLGDGTYFHSGLLAIRQALAAKTNITYKILYNDAVAMTGGQPIDGHLSVEDLARQVRAEGVQRIALVSDQPALYRGAALPAGTTVHHRRELDAVQRELREVAGVSVLLYVQTCAAEKRRRRKRREYPDPPQRLFINSAVCEGCGDCGRASNCLSIVPLETEFGRKRMIDQSSCNKDYSCADGFCPSFVTVQGGTVRKGVAARMDEAALRGWIDALPRPRPRSLEQPFNLLITGVGGTGVVTVGALVAMAAHLERKGASTLDFMGFAQKGGAVLCHVRVAARPAAIHQVRIDVGQADALLACDLVVGSSRDVLATLRPGSTRVVANTHEIPTADFVRKPDAGLQVSLLKHRLRKAAGADHVSFVDAQDAAQRLLGDAIAANVFLLGYAWQLGLVPVGRAALERAIELNGVAVPMNRRAFAFGRLAAGNREALGSLLSPGAAAAPPPLEQLVAHRVAHLTAYQDRAYAARYEAFVEEVKAAETRAGMDLALPLTRAVAHNLAKLMAYKDEYEVARLYVDAAFRQALEQQFEGDFRLRFRFAPPLLARKDPHTGLPRKSDFGPWILPLLKGLAKLKFLRGTAFDPFGWTEERRLERALVEEYRATLRELLPRLTPRTLPLVLELAQLPEAIRGFGHVKRASMDQARSRRAALLQALAQTEAADRTQAPHPPLPHAA